MDKVKAFTEGGTIYFHATNIEKYNKLIERAKKEAQQLSDTVAELENFKFQFKFSTEENTK